MNVYIFRAALYCEPCGEAAKAATPKPPGFDPANEHTFDSDDYPKGPYPDGGGEADSPQHCDECGAFLKNPLTPDGVAWLRDALAAEKRREPWRVTFTDWREHYADALA